MRKPMIRMDLKRVEVHRGAKEIRLNRGEFTVLKMLAESDGMVLAREHIARKIGLHLGSDSRLIDSIVCRIRQKLGADAIRTVTGFGYKTRMVKILD